MSKSSLGVLINQNVTLIEDQDKRERKQRLNGALSPEVEKSVNRLKINQD